MHSWLIIGAAVLVALAVARTFLGAIGRLVMVLVVIGALAFGVGSAVGGLSTLRERADCVQRYPQLGSALVNEIEHGCQTHPAPTPTALAAALSKQGIGARAMTGMPLRSLHVEGLAVPAGVTAAVVPTQINERFVVLYTTSHAAALRVKRLIASQARRRGITLPPGSSHFGVDGSVVYLDGISGLQTPVTDLVTGV
jgi:hypothetical protein